MGSLYVVATPIGNLSDITKRAIEVLNDVDYILCEDTRTSLKLLNYFNIKNKLMSYHKFNEAERVKKVLFDLKKGLNVALISDAGTPCINDPGSVIVKECKENDISVYGVGGISAFVTALSISGLDTSSFTFCGFFPREKQKQVELIKEINKSSVKTFVFYESPKRIVKSLEFLCKQLPNAKVNVCKELTKIHEKSFYGNINLVLENLKLDDKTSVGEYTFIVEKEEKKELETANEKNISIEAMLVDKMIKNNITLKEAIDFLNKESSDLSKKDIYNASLNVKNLI